MPYFQHDCDSCVYLGSSKWETSHDGKIHMRDHYFCPDCDAGTVISRYSSDGGDYLSVSVKNINIQSNLAGIALLAIQKGLISTEDVKLVGYHQQ